MKKSKLKTIRVVMNKLLIKMYSKTKVNFRNDNLKKIKI